MSAPALRFLADESCDLAVVRALRADGYDVLAVSEVTQRSDDRELIDQAAGENRILLTEDKDFGWLVYASHAKSAGVILLRFPGDARQTLATWTGKADAWFLDGFSPAKNPELWSSDLMAEVARHTAPGGTFATYTAAGHVRRALGEAGFTVTRQPGFGRKRHMTTGILR